jgi:adenylylsulfate kinase
MTTIMTTINKTTNPCAIGYSGVGKSSLACEAEKQLMELGLQTSLLDGDIARTGLCKDLSFSKQDREEDIRRVTIWRSN